MKERKDSFFPLGKTFYLIVISTLILIGISMAVFSLIRARQAVYTEHDKHLTDLAYLVDHNIHAVLDQCSLELENIGRRKKILAGESRYEENGSTDALSEALADHVLMSTDYVSGIMVWFDEKPIFFTDAQQDPACFSFTQQVEGNLKICKNNQNDSNYLVITQKESNGHYTYGVLIDLENFYRKVVVNTIYEDYWILLYNEANDLTLQNDYTQPEYKILTKEEIRKRNDGYTLALKAQESGAIQCESYRFTNDEGQEYGNRMVVVPSSLSENGIFSVGIAIYDNDILFPTGSMTLLIIISAFLIAFGAAGMAFLLLHNGKREKELAGEILSLEKENELTTRLMKQQEELAHHQKLETIGILTAGVAHEFNNLLSPIMGCSLLLLEKLSPEDTDNYDNALDVYQSSLRAKELVSKISMLSRKNASAEMGCVDAKKLLESMLKVTASSIPKNIEIHTESNAQNAICGNEAQLGHMLINLIFNAVQAMEPQGGRITIVTWDEGNDVCLSVSDTGPGIPEKDLKLIFEPFYTTKVSGKGTGLGLAIIQRTVVNHHGWIIAENRPEGGACFTVHLPKAEEKPKETEA